MATRGFPSPTETSRGRRPRWRAVWVWLWLAGALCGAPVAASDALRLYVDADFTHTPAVGDGIVLGVRTALALYDPGGRIELVVVDHRANARRSLRTLERAARDPRAVGVIGGMHSPPYLMFNDEINALEIPVLLPWSAGGAITRRSAGRGNWFFRVSVDDTKAAPFLVREAATSGCRRPGLVVLDNSWGLGNAELALSAMAELGLPRPKVHVIPISGGPQLSRRIVQALIGADADCAILVANPEASADMLRSVHESGRGITIFSHWGILGQPAAHLMPARDLSALDIRILGTCGLSRTHKMPSYEDRVLDMAATLASEPVELRELTAPHAFLHAFDLTRLFLEALSHGAEPGSEMGDMGEVGIEARRAALRDGLYAVRELEGFLKTYQRPFSPVSAANPDGHEALGAEDLCLSRFGADGHLLPIGG